MLMPVIFKTVWRLCLVVLLVSVETTSSADAPASGASADGQRLEGRAITIALGGSSYFIEAPIAIRTPVGVVGIHDPGLTHSGYTQVDPDGKVILLTATLLVKAQPLNDSEISQLKMENFAVLAPAFTITAPEAAQLDVSLPASHDEEVRLRGVLNLPRSLSAAGITLPIQIKWSGLSGKTAYSWLTSEMGLKFVVRYRSTITGTSSSTPFIGQSVRASWWLARYGAAQSAISHEGIAATAFDLITFASAWKDGPTLLALSATDANNLRNTIDFLSTVAVLQPDKSVIYSKSSLLNGAWPSSISTLDFVVRPVASTLPGAELKSHPELVKDLSGSGVGLEALLKDGS